MNTRARIRRYWARRHNVQVFARAQATTCRKTAPPHPHQTSDMVRLSVLLQKRCWTPPAWEKTLKTSSATTSSKMSRSTKRYRTLSSKRTSKTSTETPTASCPPSSPSRNPLWGLLGAALDECNNVRRIAGWGSPGRGSAVAKETDTRQPHPPSNNSKRSVTHHRTQHAALATPWLSPSFTSHVSPQGRGHDLPLSPPRPRQKGQPSRWWWWWCVWVGGRGREGGMRV